MKGSLCGGRDAPHVQTRLQELSVLAFDEAVIPSRSRFHPVRQYLKDKQHLWRTKLFMTCCAHTAYCLRYVVD